MASPTVGDVMTTEVIAVCEGTLVSEVARTMDGRRISALPVTDDRQRVVGVVSQADLLPRRMGSPLGWLSQTAWLRKASGRVAGDVMTSPATTITGDATVAEAARRMVRHGVKRLPVVDSSGRLAGIVSRVDLLRVFIRADDELRAEIEREVFERALGLPPGAVRAEVSDGEVTLTGEVDSESLIPVAESLTREVTGVVDVVSRLTRPLGDTHQAGTATSGLPHERRRGRP
ncbi:CBS domain-containing protein [Amycolatopsis taiwanensis]|uniref:CBS domain-containing protein n=1 Tax=Amycolatopsis taiwanensis TaxID=342230 RepID=A0A9W6R2V5_9PSEU|nr:CBS domain-containing protein [Amycolatopsis taiwanensis]GLY67786.1 hypothetical protein Atai01_44050 [Amycolatopsis taiwanensis]